jgi:hypothetical protein
MAQRFNPHHEGWVSDSVCTMKDDEEIRSTIKDGECSGHQEPEYSRGRLCKALGSWGSRNLEGRGGYIGKGWVYNEGVGQDGSVISNLGPEWTFLSQLEGAK